MPLQEVQLPEEILRVLPVGRALHRDLPVRRLQELRRVASQRQELHRLQGAAPALNRVHPRRQLHGRGDGDAQPAAEDAQQAVGFQEDA